MIPMAMCEVGRGDPGFSHRPRSVGGQVAVRTCDVSADARLVMRVRDGSSIQWVKTVGGEACGWDTPRAPPAGGRGADLVDSPSTRRRYSTPSWRADASGRDLVALRPNVNGELTRSREAVEASATRGRFSEVVRGGRELCGWALPSGADLDCKRCLVRRRRGSGWRPVVRRSGGRRRRRRAACRPRRPRGPVDHQQAAYLDVQARLLGQLSGAGLRRGLPRLDEAAGDFPGDLDVGGCHGHGYAG
jgi:hypothetical protein